MKLQSQESTELDLENLILAMLAYAGGVLRGKTRLQKGVFLIQQHIGGVNAEYVPHKYGPYSRDVDQALEKLAREKLIIIKEEPGGEEAPVQVIKLTESGWLKAEAALDKIKRHPMWNEIIRPIFELAIRRPLMALLTYIYAFYPEFTVNSIIKHKINKWKNRKRLKLL